MLKALGHWLADYLTSPGHSHSTSPPTPLSLLRRSLRPGDVLLVEGNSRISEAIKYLTQSTWSHAALYIGDYHAPGGGETRPAQFIEAHAVEGVRVVGMDVYRDNHCRICRPVGVTQDEISTVITFALNKLGHKYDLKNIIDLMRYLIPTPPVPVRWRRRMIALGSGDPTRAICSTLIAQSFQAIRYPVLPDISTVSAATADCPGCVEELLRVRHHSLFVPRDFDVSPYFEVVKPTITSGFDFHAMKWAQMNEEQLNELNRLTRSSTPLHSSVNRRD
ncbi:MAG: YiiX/YebB-like N1pC/P60 family cysteine hydrolase [Micropepsaceae bacterium]